MRAFRVDIFSFDIKETLRVITFLSCNHLVLHCSPFCKPKLQENIAAIRKKLLVKFQVSYSCLRYFLKFRRNICEFLNFIHILLGLCPQDFRLLFNLKYWNHFWLFLFPFQRLSLGFFAIYPYCAGGRVS